MHVNPFGLQKSEEYRNDLHQLSFCYRANLTEDTGNIELTVDEVQDGLTHEWVDLEKPLQSMEKKVAAYQRVREVYQATRHVLRQDFSQYHVGRL